MAQRHLMGAGGAFDLIVVRNVGDHPVTLRHRNVGDVVVKPGKQRTIPIAVALVNLGNPAARDNGRDKARSDEFKQIRRKWGFCEGFFTESAWAGKGTDTLNPVNPDGSPREIGPFCPPIECYNLDGERIYFVHDDPDGTIGSGERAAREALEASDDRFRDQALEEMRAEIARLHDLIANREDATATDDDGTSEPAADSAPTPDDEQSQAERNEQRDEIPTPPADEPPITPDKPASTRVGRGSK